MHNKLTQILNLIGENESNTDETGEDLIRNEEEFTRKMAEEVYDEKTDEEDADLDLYHIQADELEED